MDENVDVDIGDGEANGCELSRKARPQVSQEEGGGKRRRKKGRDRGRKRGFPTSSQLPMPKGRPTEWRRITEKRRREDQDQRKREYAQTKTGYVQTSVVRL